jgi:hypothetical protein
MQRTGFVKNGPIADLGGVIYGGIHQGVLAESRTGGCRRDMESAHGDRHATPCASDGTDDHAE